MGAALPRAVGQGAYGMRPPGKEIYKLPDRAGFDDGLTFSPDGTLLVTAGVDKKVRVWDAATGKELATLTGHTGGVHCITISPDGKYLATGGDDKVVIVWNLTNNERVYSLGELDDVITSISLVPTRSAWLRLT